MGRPCARFLGLIFDDSAMFANGLATMDDTDVRRVTTFVDARESRRNRPRAGYGSPD